MLDAVIEIWGNRVPTRSPKLILALEKRPRHLLQHPAIEALPIYTTFTMATTSISRARTPIAVLLDPKTDIPLGERDIRAEDYLNDKIQTTTDLESLESLIASVEAQKQQLEDQVGDQQLIYQPRCSTKSYSSSQMRGKSSPKQKTSP